MKILVIDDNKIILRAVATTLEKNGFEVAVTDNPLLAAFIIGRERPDLILLDLEMPAVTGEDLLISIVETYEIFEPSRIILFTASSNIRLIKGLVETYGLGGYINKCAGDEFIRQLSHLIGLANH